MPSQPITATLSSQGIIVLPHGAVKIPDNVDFQTDYVQCDIGDAGDLYKIRYLAERWHYFNKHLYGGAMHEPKFLISRKVRTLGSWGLGTKSMTFGRRMFKLRNEYDLLGTLVHEMAHQYVDLVLKVREWDAHGPSWQGVMLGIGMTTDAKYSGPALKSVQRESKEDDLDRALRNNQTLRNKGLDDSQVVLTDKYTVMRYLEPAKLKDHPVVVEPIRRATGLYAWGWEVKKDGRLGMQQGFSTKFLVIPGPLKIRTPLYRKAQEHADEMNKPVGSGGDSSSNT